MFTTLRRLLDFLLPPLEYPQSPISRRVNALHPTGTWLKTPQIRRVEARRSSHSKASTQTSVQRHALDG
ncbi:hypothetical protein FA13DRAFT_812752 [Coprinellus micaceus]|uniref:Uncharacterized protein n=1 Tax=Coprinellus micaceus TaxID=71717 RepID=A0A4Y7S436_COPMI|nr:hypothetical protein FA13DRAFT_812752 [Coprinellus micaceus]